MDEAPAPHHGPVISIWPPLVAVGISLLIIGIITSIFVSIAGIAILLFSLASWTHENRVTEARLAQEEQEAEEREVEP